MMPTSLKNAQRTSFPFRSALLVCTSVMGIIVIVSQAVLYALNEKWFGELEELCSNSPSSCLNGDEEALHSEIREENIAAVVLVVWALLALVVIIKRPTEAQLPFTLLTLSSRPVFYVTRIIRTLSIRARFPDPGASLRLILPFEAVELVIWFLFLCGFTLYAYIALRSQIKLAFGTIWKPSVSAVCLFVVETVTRANIRNTCISLSFVVIALLVAIGLRVINGYYYRCRLVQSRTVLDEPRPSTRSLPSSHLPPSPLSTRSSMRGSNDPEMSRTSQESGLPSSSDRDTDTASIPAFRDFVSSESIQDELTIPSTDETQMAPAQDREMTALTVSPLASFTSASPPSFSSQPPCAFPSRASSFADDESFHSITTYQTLPSYHSRQGSFASAFVSLPSPVRAFPPSSFPIRALPALPHNQS
ncbi:hypothetical protein Moror_8272 [Moniliophthora roreri MCA 2997]|uniref:Uncharacterized protein n=2 Tax=Moniliophthora roreri TaxID=221103 RepID=V2XKN5_MONRO|nr:hypothetical protein Moror_8272 [Moniliophthora roreri MCA 2997]KAI3608066.1 hypothetical protein WG66_005180 [Moniliophthora roreri]